MENKNATLTSVDQIDTSTIEGKCLLMCIAQLTALFGDMHPDEVLVEIVDWTKDPKLSWNIKKEDV